MQYSSSDDFAIATAVLTIQSVWRRNFSHVTSAKVVEAFIRHGPSVKRAKALAYDDLNALLHEKNVLAVTRHCVRRLHILATHRHGSPSEAFRPDSMNVRVFVTTFMIAFHSATMFESMGVLERSLSDAAARLLDIFFSICKQLRALKAFRHVPAQATLDFVPALWDFVKLFHAWKGPDQTKLLGRVRHALATLYDAEGRLPPDLPHDAALRLKFKTQIESLRHKLHKLAGAEALREMDAGRSAPSAPIANRMAVQMTNDALTHELLVNPDFVFREGHLANDARFPIEFWDRLEANLRRTPPNYRTVFELICNLKARLCDLSPDEKPRLDEAINCARLRKPMHAGTYRAASCVGLAGAIYAVVRRLCNRKEAVETEWDRVRLALESDAPAALGPALRFFSKCVNDLRLDAANARLRQIAPELKDHGVEYERGRFQDNVNRGVYTLECVTAALSGAVDRAVQSEATSLEALRRGSDAAFAAVHQQLMRDLVLVEFSPPLLEGGCPETLRFDVRRLNDLRAAFVGLTTRSAMLTTLKHALRARPDVLEPAVRQLVEAEDLDGAISGHEEGELLLNLRQCAHPENGVRRLMYSRLSDLIAGGLGDNGKLPNSVHLTKTLVELAPCVHDLLARLHRLSDLNYRVHRHTYHTIVRKAVASLSK